MAKSGGCLKLGQYLIGFVVFVGVAAVITSLAPVSLVSFERHGDTVSARTHILLFLLVPVHLQVIDPVTEIDGRRDFIASQDGRVRRVRQVGFLVIRGGGQTIEIPVSPMNLGSVKKRAQDFLSDPGATDLTMTLVSSWLVGVGSVVFSLLAVVYIVGVAVAIGRFIGLLPPPGKANESQD